MTKRRELDEEQRQDADVNKRHYGEDVKFYPIISRFTAFLNTKICFLSMQHTIFSLRILTYDNSSSKSKSSYGIHLQRAKLYCNLRLGHSPLNYTCCSEPSHRNTRRKAISHTTCSHRNNMQDESLSTHRHHKILLKQITMAMIIILL